MWGAESVFKSERYQVRQTTAAIAGQFLWDSQGLEGEENHAETSGKRQQYGGWNILWKGEKIWKGGLNKKSLKFAMVYFCKFKAIEIHEDIIRSKLVFFKVLQANLANYCLRKKSMDF